MLKNKEMKGYEEMIELRNVSKTYKIGKETTNLAIDNISCKINDGEFVVILGESGNGKTTFLNLISGLVMADDGGDILVNGKSTKDYTQSQWDGLRADKIGYIFENSISNRDFTVADSVFVGMNFTKISIKEMIKRMNKTLKVIGLEEKKNCKVKDITDEELQRTGIGFAIGKDPEYIIADEPTGKLNVKDTIKLMECLKKVSKGKTLIMATHSEKLAKKYADRIIKLENGKIIEDINNKKEATVKTKETVDEKIVKAGSFKEQNDKNKDKKNAKMYKSKLPLATGIASSFWNFSTKWKRYVLIIVAGAIGIIGISVIVSIATGLTNYIKTAEDTLYSQHPLVFDQKRDLDQIEEYQKMQEQIKAASEEKDSEIAKSKKDAEKTDKVALRNKLGTLLSTTGSADQSDLKVKNDIASLKKYLDTNPDNFNSCVADVEYTYRTTPVIYAQNINGIHEIYPRSGLFGSVGSGSADKGLEGSKTRIGASSAASLSKKIFSNIGSLPREQSLYKDDDCLVAGHWPTTPYECLLVLNSDGTIDDTLLYTLGMRDFQKDVEPLIEKYKKGEAVEFPGQTELFEYSDFIGKKLKMINPSDCFEYNSETKLWEDKSNDDERMGKILENAKDLPIVGVVKPNYNSVTGTILNTGIMFPFELNEVSIEQTMNSQIVKDQLSSPKVDVLTGETFEYLENASTIFQRKDMHNLVNFNLDMLIDSIKIHPEALSLDLPEDQRKPLTDKEKMEIIAKLIKSKEFKEFIADIFKEGKFDKGVYDILVESSAKYAEYVAKCKEEGIEPLAAKEWYTFPNEGFLYVQKACIKLPADMMEDALSFIKKYGPKLADAAMELLKTEIDNLIQRVVKAVEEYNGPDFIEFDQEKFSQALKINITMDDIKQMAYVIIGATKHTFESNLADFGYADLNDPVGLTIYPKDNSGKQQIISIIEKYNNEIEKTDKNKIVTYVDNIGWGVKVATSIIDILSKLLIVVISSALIVSTLLTGVILGITDMRRHNDIAYMRAAGARRRDVLRFFNCEAGVLGLLTGVFGIGVTYLINAIINSSIGIDFKIAQLNFTTALIMVGISIVLTLIAGIIPNTVVSMKNMEELQKGRAR